MKSILLRAPLLLALSGVFFAAISPAIADQKTGGGIPSEFRGDGNVPLCDTPSVLKKVSKRFGKNHAKHYDSTLKIDNIKDVRETDFISNPSDRTDRRFCVGHAHLNDGKIPHVYYLIQEREGLASLTWGVDYCVEGLDFERAHGENCRSLRKPF